ncbi:DUF4041 domain-containing protein [Enteractinococcus helveticum]|nr:DUF4041 domain-containing protein [Enteractinococcus helveticum]
MPPEQHQRPTSVSTLFYVLTVISLVIASLLLVTLPLTIPALIYVFSINKREKNAQERLSSISDELDQTSAILAAIRSENDDLRDAFTRIDGMDILQREDEARRLDEKITEQKAEFENILANQTSELEALEELKETEKNKISELKTKVVDLEEMFNLNDYGLYNFENPANDSVRYSEQLQKVKVDIKRMVKNKTATSASTTWTVNNSAAQGRKMVNDMSKLLLRAFNAEAENSIKTVRAGHLTTALKRLDRSAQAVARLGKMMDLRITSAYVRLREEELRLTHAHLEAKKAAKELEREERAREREERRAQREFEAAKAKQIKEVEHYRTVLETLQSSGDEVAIASASANLTAAEEKLADVESTMANTRAGYVYVISNRGAFGQGIVKIGMTRRLDPMDRVRELGDASVPFYFDAHTMIFAKDAVGLERALHKHFAEVRVNLVNLRREYFYSTPAEVKAALMELYQDYEAQLLEFHETADAPEYEASEDMRGRGNIPQPAALTMS